MAQALGPEQAHLSPPLRLGKRGRGGDFSFTAPFPGILLRMDITTCVFWLAAVAVAGYFVFTFDEPCDDMTPEERADWDDRMQW